MEDEQINVADYTDTLRKTTEALLRLMGFSTVSVAIRKQSEGEPVIVAISTDEAGMLIGEHGMNLQALEYITKLIARKIVPDAPRFIVDINNYREENIAGLKDYAREAASRAVREAREIELEPMSSYERRIIHAELTSRPDIKTESVGEGADRRVVVKPSL